jgi:hypothetical protein
VENAHEPKIAQQRDQKIKMALRRVKENPRSTQRVPTTKVSNKGEPTPQGPRGLQARLIFSELLKSGGAFFFVCCLPLSSQILTTKFLHTPVLSSSDQKKRPPRKKMPRQPGKCNRAGAVRDFSQAAAPVPQLPKLQRKWCSFAESCNAGAAASGEAAAEAVQLR